jgi:predicted Zn-dependent protease
MREVRRDPAYLDDPLLLDYLQTLWSPLVAAAHQRSEIGSETDAVFAWEAFLVRDRSVNAFALPGGFVGVHLGLIAMTASGDELASVLAHELSHVTQRHIARSIASSSRQSAVGMAAMLLGVLAAGRAGSVDVAQAAIMGGQAAMIQGQLNFSRDMEREADRIGYGVLTTAGYAPGGMAAMFEKLENASRLNDDGAFPYLRSHPLNAERIGEARARAQAAAATASPPATLEHTLMQARSRVLMDGTEQALRRVQAQDMGSSTAGAAPSERLSALYGSAMASGLLREPARALQALAQADTLLRAHAAREPRVERVFTLLRAQTLLTAGQPSAALALLDRTDDGSRSVLLLRAQAALDSARAGGDAAQLKRSGDALLTWVTTRRQDALAWGVLAQCAGQLGLRLRAVRAEAEARAALGDLNGALDRLRAGQRLARSGGAQDFIESSVIDSRARELDRERRQLYAEMHGGREMPLR